MAEKKISTNFAKSSLALSAFVIIIAVGIGVFIYSNSSSSGTKHDITNPQLTYWPIVLQPWQKDNLRSVKRVFDRLGYRIVNGTEEHWDVMWSLEYPFDRFPEKLIGFKKHQVMNHIPGMTFLTNKMHLAVGTQSKYIPVAFEFPRLKNEFIYYAKINSKAKFVVKNFDNRGVKIVHFKDMDFHLGDKKFVQLFIDNPLLVDGHAFDIGVYVLVASVDPLRIYRFKTDVFLRFCPEPYHPFNDANVDKYVVSETHLPYWEIPSFKTATNVFNFSALNAFENYLEELQCDVEKFWEQIDDAIVSTPLSKLHYMSRYSKTFGHNAGVKRFELLRFDFIVDDKFNIHLMEINMSPNLTPTIERDERHAVMYEQLIYNIISIMGLRNKLEMEGSLENSAVLSANKDIAVDLAGCIENNCDENCSNIICDLCIPCLSNETVQSLHQGYREHHRKGKMMRLFPKETHMQEKIMDKLTPLNKLSVKWFKAKCDEDFEWC